MKENINALTMLVDAENRQAAYKIAEQANNNLFNNPDAYIYLEDLGCEEWLVILASDEDNAKQARQKYFADTEWEDSEW